MQITARLIDRHEDYTRRPAFGLYHIGLWSRRRRPSQRLSSAAGSRRSTQCWERPSGKSAYLE